VLYTDALVQRAGIDPQAQGLIAHRETIDIIGEVNCWVGDLNASWKAKQERRWIEVSPAERSRLARLTLLRRGRRLGSTSQRPVTQLCGRRVRRASMKMSSTVATAPARGAGRQAAGRRYGRFVALAPLLEQSMRTPGEMPVKQLAEAAVQQRAAASTEPEVPASAVALSRSRCGE
jgi:hypothetical protein